jgi:hypothetical protein
MKSGGWNVNLVFLLSLSGFLVACWAQQNPQNPYLADRDPRWYSRPGVKDYNPPSPGDKDYRWELNHRVSVMRDIETFILGGASIKSTSVASSCNFYFHQTKKSH